MEALRSLHIVIDLADRVTTPLKQINQSVDNFKKKIGAATKPIREMQAECHNMSQALAQSRYFFAQMDLAAKEATIRTKYAAKPVQDLAIAFEHAKYKLSLYIDTLKTKLKNATRFIEQHKAAIAGLGAALSAFAYGGFRFFSDATKELANFQDAMRVFRAYAGENADAILKAMEEAAEGTIDSTQMILNANRAIVMGIDPEYLPRMMKIARAAARAMGTDVQYMFESIAVGTARQSKLILDNLGIIVNAEAAYEKYAKQLGKTADKLTEAEKRQAFINAVMEAGEKLVRKVDLSQETLNEQLMKSRVAWTEFKKALAEGALPVITAFTDNLEKLTTWLKDLPKPIKAVIGTLGVLATGASAVIGPLLMQAFLTKEIGGLAGLTAMITSFKTAILGLASSTLAAIAPILPVILAISAAILLLQHAWVHNWGGIREATAKVVEGIKWAFGGLIDIIKTFISGFIEPLKYLFGPILEALGLFNKEAGESKILVEIVDTVAGVFRWLYSIIEPHIPLIKQMIKVVGFLAAGFLLLTNPIGQVVLAISAVSYVLKAVIPHIQRFKSIWDRTIGWIIAKISEFISAIQNTWKAISENPLFKAAQAVLQFIQPKIKPIIEKPEMDKDYYEEGSIVLKVRTPKIKPEIEEPETPSIQPLIAPIKFILDRLPELKAAGAKYFLEVPKLPEIPAAISTIHSPTYIKNEHKTIHAPISIKIEGGQGSGQSC